MIAIIISYSDFLDNETKITNSLFDKGLKIFHLRKKDAGKNEIENFIRAINKEHHKKIVLHNNFELVEKYNLKGYHFGNKTLDLIKDFYDNNFSKSISCHSFEEIENLEYDFDYVFLSPVFDSISKENYKSGFKFDELKSFLAKNNKHKIIALGGVTEDKIETVKEMGFDGFAILGDFWINKRWEQR